MTDEIKTAAVVPVPVQVVKKDPPSPPLPVSASNAPPVALAGIPVTPASEAGVGSTGPAVPSVDSYLTEASPNKETSSPTPPPSGATAEVSGK